MLVLSGGVSAGVFPAPDLGCFKHAELTVFYDKNVFDDLAFLTEVLVAEENLFLPLVDKWAKKLGLEVAAEIQLLEETEFLEHRDSLVFANDLLVVVLREDREMAVLLSHNRRGPLLVPSCQKGELTKGLARVEDRHLFVEIIDNRVDPAFGPQLHVPRHP